MNKKIKKYIFRPREVIYIFLVKYLNMVIPEELYLKLIYRLRVKEKLDLENPTSYNEKLQWLKINWYDPLARKCADKYLVREYVEETIGKKYLNNLLGVYTNVDDITLSELPNQFVLKGTHGSGFNLIVKDKDSLNWEKETKNMKKWLNTDYSKYNKEWVYNSLEPKIIAEEYIASNEENELKDYRFFCFHGEPKFITVDFSITNKENTRRNIYDLDWNLMTEEIHYPREVNEKVDRPKHLEKMIKLAKELSEPFPHVRVDFFYYNNEIIFGELTFFHQSGMANIRPNEFNDKLGSWLKLPRKGDGICKY